MAGPELACVLYTSWTNPGTAKRMFPTVPGGNIRAFVCSNLNSDLSVPPTRTGNWDAHAFQVRAMARITTGTSTTPSFALYYNAQAGTSGQDAFDLTASSSDTALATLGPITYLGTRLYVIIATCSWCPNSNRLSGIFWDQADTTLQASVGGFNSITNVSSPDKLNFCCGISFAASDAGNKAELLELSLSML